MNRKQRESNRQMAKWLDYYAHTCPECGERGKHYVSMPITLEAFMMGIPHPGFWTCAKFYGADGRRLDEAPYQSTGDSAAEQKEPGNG